MEGSKASRRGAEYLQDKYDDIKTKRIRLPREAVRSVQRRKVCAKEKKAALKKKVSQILQKPETERTCEEAKILKSSSKVVREINLKKIKREEAKRRLEEFEDPDDVLNQKCQILAQAIAQSQHLVVYTGAGISTAAKIPDYRGPDGIWTRLKEGRDIGDHDLSLAEPTYTHMALSELYRQRILKYVVSQNCDGLHLRSGLPKTALSEVHGNMYMEVCKDCKPPREYWRLFDVTESTARYSHKTYRRCYVCNGALMDTIVHFGERGSLQWPLNWKGACKNAKDATTILCIGSSLKVLKKYPWLWQMDKPIKKRPNLYIINLQWTPKDEFANVKVNGKCDVVFKKIMDILGIYVPKYDKNKDPIFYHATGLHELENHTTTKFTLSFGDALKVECKNEETLDKKVDSSCSSVDKEKNDRLSFFNTCKDESNCEEETNCVLDLSKVQKVLYNCQDACTEEDETTRFNKIDHPGEENQPDIFKNRAGINTQVSDFVLQNGFLDDHTTPEKSENLGVLNLSICSNKKRPTSENEIQEQTECDRNNHCRNFEQSVKESSCRVLFSEICAKIEDNTIENKTTSGCENDKNNGSLDFDNHACSSGEFAALKSIVEVTKIVVEEPDISSKESLNIKEVNPYKNGDNSLILHSNDNSKSECNELALNYSTNVSALQNSEENKSILKAEGNSSSQSSQVDETLSETYSNKDCSIGDRPDLDDLNCDTNSSNNSNLSSPEDQQFVPHSSQQIMESFVRNGIHPPFLDPRLSMLSYNFFQSQIMMGAYTNFLLYPYQTSFLYPGIHSIINPLPMLKEEITPKCEVKEEEVDPQCEFCHKNYKSAVCLFYEKIEPTFKKELSRYSKIEKKDKPNICECCDYTTEEDDDIDDDSTNDKDRQTDSMCEQKTKVQPGWFGKGYRKGRRLKRKLL